MPVAEFQQATLEECMLQQGCPLCRAIWKMDTTQFDWYVNDGVLDEETQRRVIRAVGFCAPHALSLSIIEGSDFLWSHLGSCMTYVNVIENALLPDLEKVIVRSDQRFLHFLGEKFFSPLRHLLHHDLCPLCFDHRQHEATYREQFAQRFSADAGFRRAYLQASSLCVPHFQQVRTILAGQSTATLLESAELRALGEGEQTAWSGVRKQLWQSLSLLYGADTLLWADFIPRAAICASDVGPAPCLTCQQSDDVRPQLHAALLDDLEEVLQCGEESPGLSVCSWHAWWVFHQMSLQPRGASRLEPLLRRTCATVRRQVMSARYESQPCQICGWMKDQDIMQVGKLQPKLADPEQHVPLCLHHARAALWQPSDEATARDVAHALRDTLAPLAKRLEAYVHKCTERFQDQMQPDEQVAWFDALRWFGGSETAQFLLAPSTKEWTV
jgi:hypothetical protein